MEGDPSGLMTCHGNGRMEGASNGLMSCHAKFSCDIVWVGKEGKTVCATFICTYK